MKALKVREEIGDKIGIGSSYENIGNVFHAQKNYLKAEDYYSKGLRILKQTNAKSAIATGYLNLGATYSKLKKEELSISYSDSAYKLSKKIGDLNTELSAAQNLANSFYILGNYKAAFENHVIFKQLTDSVFNIENSRQLGDLKTNFEVEKKEAELKAKAEIAQAISIEEKNKQQLIIYMVAGVLLIVIFFLGLLYKKFKLTNKQKLIIELKSKETEAQKHLIEEKQKEILDSIHYAKRIQVSLLPPEKFIEKTVTRLKNNI